MNLYIVGRGHYHFIVRSADVRRSEYVTAVDRKTHPTSFDRLVKTIDEAIEWLVQHPSQASQLVWGNAGLLFGDNTLQPKRRIDHLWDNIIAAVGDSTPCLKALGTLLKWRVAVRAETTGETWLMYSQETDRKDAITGETIYINTYWIDDNFTPNLKPKVKPPDWESVATKWGATLKN